MLCCKLKSELKEDKVTPVLKKINKKSRTENTMDSAEDPLNQSSIESNQDNEEIVKAKRKFNKVDDEDVGWTHEYETTTMARDLNNFPRLCDTSLPTYSKRAVCDPSRKRIVEDPLNQSSIENNKDNEGIVKAKRKFNKVDEEDVGWTHEYEETIVRELKNFPCLWDTSLPTFSKRAVCDPSRKHIVFMLKQNHPTASKEIQDKLFTQSSVSRKIRNLRLAYKKIKKRDGFNAKWRHFRQLAFLESNSANNDHHDNKFNGSRDLGRDFDYEDTMYRQPFITMKCENDETSSIETNRVSKRFDVQSADAPERRSPRIHECKCHSVFKFAQTVMDQLPVEQQKKFTVDLTRLLLKYQENNL